MVVFLVVDLLFESLNDTDRTTNRKPINSAMVMMGERAAETNDRTGSSLTVCTELSTPSV
ncbi:hypothetical protein WT08_24260 [Burkholderia sp. MSMB1552]|nr:hypothetical protein AQ610_31430 [Burkholderia humptydooensis]KVN03235.1 hypothetical protein WT08_24260 [Burkholderia sp. MSMB1552]KWZ49896.1 hypothetical protein WS92_20740 [Burkholderia sp. MSMB1588]